MVSKTTLEYVLLLMLLALGTSNLVSSDEGIKIY